MADDALAALVAEQLVQRGVERAALGRLTYAHLRFVQRSMRHHGGVGGLGVCLLRRRAAPLPELGQHVTPAVAPALGALSEVWLLCAWDKASISAAFKTVLAAHSLKMPQLAMPVRVLTVGTAHTPSVDAVLELVGREKFSRVCRTAKNLYIIQGCDDDDVKYCWRQNWGIAQAGRALAWHAKRSSVRSRLPPPQVSKFQGLTLSSRGLGHHPFTVSTGVRIPVGSPSCALGLCLRCKRSCLPGVVVQLVRIPACHAGGRGFESRPLRQIKSACGSLFCSEEIQSSVGYSSAGRAFAWHARGHRFDPALPPPQVSKFQGFDPIV